MNLIDIPKSCLSLCPRDLHIASIMDTKSIMKIRIHIYSSQLSDLSRVYNEDSDALLFIPTLRIYLPIMFMHMEPS